MNRAVYAGEKPITADRGVVGAGHGPRIIWASQAIHSTHHVFFARVVMELQ